MPFSEPSDETYVAFGRLTVAFGRLEGTVDWLMAMLIFHAEGKSSVSPEIWKEYLVPKVERVKQIARDADLPDDLRTAILEFAGTTKRLARERRQLVHGLVMHELPRAPAPVVSVLRTGSDGGYGIREVPLDAVRDLALLVGKAAEMGLALTKGVADLSPED